MTVVAIQPNAASHTSSPGTGWTAPVIPLHPTGTVPIARYVAPVRFDVHALAAFDAWATDQLAAGHDLVVDLHRVEFIDLRAVASIRDLTDRAAARGRSAMTQDHSPAAHLTFELMDRVA
ncbi:MAG: STAS domain-containing protein [Acidimicrobiales bacterium]